MVIMAWIDSILLEKDESIIEKWEGERELIEKTHEKSKKQKWKIKDHKDGFLVLTSKRLLFVEAQENSDMPFDEPVEIQLANFSDSWMQKQPFENIEEKPVLETHVFRLKKVGKKKDFDNFKNLINKYCNQRKTELAKGKNKVSFKL
jgi:hypothetical protein